MDKDGAALAMEAGASVYWTMTACVSGSAWGNCKDRCLQLDAASNVAGSAPAAHVISC